MKVTLKLLGAPFLGLALVVFLPVIGIMLTVEALGRWVWSTWTTKRNQF